MPTKWRECLSTGWPSGLVSLMLQYAFGFVDTVICSLELANPMFTTQSVFKIDLVECRFLEILQECGKRV
jgi:hypothetical protein